MAARKKGLGKGLDALLGPHTASEIAAMEGDDELRILPVDLLRRSAYQPRSEFDKATLQELADSIRAQGIIQPIVVRPGSSGQTFEIIAGERRWRAAQLAGLQEVPTVVRKLDDRSAMCLSLIENIQREDLNPLEQARALARLLEEFDMNHADIAEAVGRSRSAVSNLLRLLDLDAHVKRLLEKGELDMGHARALLTLPAQKQRQAADEIRKKGLSVRGAEALARRLSKAPVAKPKTKPDPNISRLQTDLSARLGASVSIRHEKSGKGSLQIRYNSLHELDGILKRIK